MSRQRTFAAIALTFSFLATSMIHSQEAAENPIKNLLRRGKPVVGMVITVPSSDVVVQAANLGFDFVWIEMEHSPITLETMRNMVLATRGTNTVPIVRIPVNELWTAKRVLDSGALGVAFPFVSTAEQARQAVAACKYPPLGKRGSGPGLAILRWPAPEGYADFADKNVMVIIIIEQSKAVENIEEIASVPGIDCIYIGPSDLSYSMGFRGRQDEPKLKNAIAKVIAVAAKHKISVGGPLVNPAQAAQLIKDGFQFFGASTDLDMMAIGARPVLEALGKTGTGHKDRLLY